MNAFERRAALVRELAEVEAQQGAFMRAGIARTIVGLRNAQGLTQQQLADTAGILRTTLANIENEKQNTTLDVLLRLSGPLNTAPWELLRAAMEGADRG